MISFLRKMFGDNPERAAVQLHRSLVPKINTLEPSVRILDNAGLRAKTDEFRQRLGKGASLDDLLPDAFAVVWEAARRTLGQRHYEVQLVGGAVLHQGKIGEMRTGEGKTLVATLPAYLNALSGDGVHIVTVNDYLARRDAVWLGPLYHLLGIAVSCLQDDGAYVYDPDLESPGKNGFQYLRPVSERSEAYQADVLYGANSEFCFDYLRDNIATRRSMLAQRGRGGFAIIDEVDNILIDEARMPLVISGPSEQPLGYYRTFARLAPRLREPEHYTIDDRTQSISLTEDGIHRMENWIGVNNLYDPANFHLVQYMENAIVAQVQKIRDKDYVVQGGEAIIVDQFTGRLQIGRRWSDGLHQAVEAKEGLKIRAVNMTHATITLQNYFRLYRKLAGMTGTAVTEADEFYRIYGLDVVAVPTHEPMIRIDAPDLVFTTDRGKWNAVVEEIAARSARGQPALVGTTSVETSEMLSQRLRRRGVKHQVLNARNHAQEAGIIAQAGRVGAVTVSTNMAGRGTDIVLGGADRERDDWHDEHDRVVALGGLHIIGTEHHEARRVDNQLRGRAGRQGDPGSSQFFVSLEDELMQRFGGDRIKNLMNWSGYSEAEPLQSKFVTKSIASVQAKIEAHHFDVRKQLLKYDDVLNEQRRVIYADRALMLEDAEVRERFLAMVRAEYDELAMAHLGARYSDDWDAPGFVDEVRQICGLPPELEAPGKILDLSREQVTELLNRHAEREFADKERVLGVDNMRYLVFRVLVEASDEGWVAHLTAMEQLRTGVGLQAVGQRDPFLVYCTEGRRSFGEMRSRVRSAVARRLFHLTLDPLPFPVTGQDDFADADVSAPDVPVRQRALVSSVSHGYRGVAAASAGSWLAAVGAVPAAVGVPVSARGRGGKIGRNAQCPCGSGRKYKRCCGANA